MEDATDRYRDVAIWRFRPVRDVAAQVLLAVVAMGVAAAVTEAALRVFAPVSLVTIGHRFSDNAMVYGWGFAPNEMIVTADPDTGEVRTDHTNRGGWRDTDHVRGRVEGTFRVLVLGDSVSFGPIVALDDLYTRRTEKLLRRKGYAVEVISIALGGWGTDQELEALRVEGLAYEPDLVVVQFTANDPWDNVEPMDRGKKPFGYQLDAGGKLVRESNPWFGAKEKDQTKGRSWRYLRDHSEILKRATLLVERLRGNERPTLQRASGGRIHAEYVVTDWGITVLTQEFGIDPNSALAAWLREQRGQALSPRELRRRLRTTPQAGRFDEILRTFERHWFQGIHATQLEGMTLDPESTVGRLQFALFDEMLRLSQKSGAAFLLLSTHEDGHFDWDRYWFHVRGDPGARERYLELNVPLQAWARSRRVDFLLPNRPVTRARNDPHPNKEGNKVLAHVLADYIEAHYGRSMPHLPGEE